MTELLTHTDVLALAGLVTNKNAVELIGWAVTSITGGLLANGGDIRTLDVMLFPDLVDGVEVLRINVAMHKLLEDD